MWVDDSGQEREDIDLCFNALPQFKDDFGFFISNGLIEKIYFDRYEWKMHDTTLAEYFVKIGWDNDYSIKWSPIAAAFGKKGRTLSKLASRYTTHPKGLSERFRKLQRQIEQYRQDLEKARQQEQHDTKLFNTIKNLIEKTENGDIENIRATLGEIRAHLI